MFKGKTTLLVILVVTVGVGVAMAISMAGSAGVTAIATLFFMGFGAGWSVRGLIGARRRALAVRVPTVRPSVSSDMRRQSQRKERSRRPREKPAKSRPNAKRLTGEVKWFDESKGYGFLVPDSGEEDCFVHRSAVQGGKVLPEGKRVSFYIITDDRGRRAASDVEEIT